MPDKTRKETAVELFQVNLEEPEDGDPEVVEITDVHLVEMWGDGHPPNDEIHRRTLPEDCKERPDANGGFTTHTRGFCAVDGKCWQVVEMSPGHVPNHYDDVDATDVVPRWWTRRVDFADGHDGDIRDVVPTDLSDEDTPKVTDGGEPVDERVDYEIQIDGREWFSLSPWSDYDAIHCVAGAILARADDIHVTRHGAPDRPDDGDDVDVDLPDSVARPSDSPDDDPDAYDVDDLTHYVEGLEERIRGLEDVHGAANVEREDARHRLRQLEGNVGVADLSPEAMNDLADRVARLIGDDATARPSEGGR